VVDSINMDACVGLYSNKKVGGFVQRTEKWVKEYSNGVIYGLVRFIK